MSRTIRSAYSSTTTTSTQYHHEKYMVLRKDSSASTATTTSSYSTSDDDGEVMVPRVLPRRDTFSTTTTTTTTTSSNQILSGALTGVFVAVFSTYFPFWIDLSPNAVASTTVYQKATYSYDEHLSRFDNTFLTYGTDYGLALAMVWSAYWMAGKLVDKNNSNNKSPAATGATNRLATVAAQHQKPNVATESARLLSTHVCYSRGMLLTYMLSVLAGGLAHHFFTTLESRNTWPFRLLWTVCVGSVTAASGFMGSVGGVWAEHDRQQQTQFLPVLREPFWIAYAVVVTSVVVAGGWSYQRPAADIFVAGITQFPSTFYIMSLLYMGLPTLRLSKVWRQFGLVAFILNAPLLPAYPLLVFYAKTLSLGQVNCILHSNLLLAWIGQGRVLREVTAAWQATCGPPPSAVPVGKKPPLHSA